MGGKCESSLNIRDKSNFNTILLSKISFFLLASEGIFIFSSARSMSGATYHSHYGVCRDGWMSVWLLAC